MKICFQELKQEHDPSVCLYEGVKVPGEFGGTGKVYKVKCS